jgi:S-adenosylmethionine decarboxylase
MFFEGSEKKAEIIIDPAQVSLLQDYDDLFWQNMVAECNAKILSTISNDKVKAFLLSESSLFVWDDHLLILTCGDTRLVNSVIYFLKNIEPSSVKQVIYQRKNEYCSHLQASHVLDDTKVLQTMVDGKLLRFGELDSHHSYLYHLNNDFKGDPNDKTYELLIYNIAPEISAILTQANIDKAMIRELLQLETMIPGFELDDFIFEPFGYSLNAIRGNDYFTIHLTPQMHNSYVSFESNLDLIAFMPLILKAFNPASFDVVSYNEFDFKQKIEQYLPQNYYPKELVEENLSCSYLVNFASFNCLKTAYTTPIEIKLDGGSHVF